MLYGTLLHILPRPTGKYADQGIFITCEIIKRDKVGGGNVGSEELGLQAMDKLAEATMRTRAATTDHSVESLHSSSDALCALARGLLLVSSSCHDTNHSQTPLEGPHTSGNRQSD